MYIIQDSRHQRAEGKPAYFVEGSTMCYSPKQAAKFPTKAKAEQQAKRLRKALGYLPDSEWLTVWKVLL